MMFSLRFGLNSMFDLHVQHVPLKPWPNRQSKTNVYSWPGLMCTCIDLECLGWDQICKQVIASFSKFGHPTQVNANWVTHIHCYYSKLFCLHNGYRYISVYWKLACTWGEIWEFVWPHITDHNNCLARALISILTLWSKLLNSTLML